MPAKKTYTAAQKKAYAKRMAAKRKKAPVNKKAMAKARRPFVEIKGRSHSELFLSLVGTVTDPATVDFIDNVRDPRNLLSMSSGTPTFTPALSALLPLWSIWNPVQGVTEEDMVGQSLVAKYLTAKVEFRFPATVQINNPRYYLVHGWIKAPPNKTAYTTIVRSEFTRLNLIDYIESQLKERFDENNKQEFLDFKEKSNKNYKILGYKRVKPNQNSQQFTPNVTYNSTANATVLHGVPSFRNITVTWPMNSRKIKYTKGEYDYDYPQPNVPFYYNNDGWTPFLMYYSPDAGTHTSAGETNCPGIAYDNKLWFSDS